MYIISKGISGKGTATEKQELFKQRRRWSLYFDSIKARTNLHLYIQIQHNTQEF